MRPDPPPPRPRGAPLWTLPALLALLALPSVAGPALLALAAVGALALTGVRAWRASRSAQAAAEQPGSVVFGRELAGADTVLGADQLAAHGLILGASGSGKTTSLLRILTERIRAGAPVVAIDMKASPAFERTLREACTAAERPLRVWRPSGPERWNPLAHGNATELKDKLIGSERFSEPHYQRLAERYLQLALGVLIERHPARAPDLAEVIDALEPRRLARLATHLAPAREQQIAEYVATLGPDGVSAVRGLATRLALLAESHAGPFLREAQAGPPPAGRVDLPPQGHAAGGIDLRRALDGEEVVLFSLPSSTLGSLAAQLGTLAVQDLTSAAGHRLHTGPGRVATVGIDEFSGLGGDHLEHLLARGRESGVSVILATQELADLERAGRGFADQVVGVTTLKVIHRQDVPASAVQAAAMAGTEEVWEETHRIRTPTLGRRAADRGTRRLVERHRIHPDTIASLPTGRALVITKVPAAQVRLVDVTPTARPAPVDVVARSAPPVRAPAAEPAASSGGRPGEAPCSPARPEAERPAVSPGTGSRLPPAREGPER